MSFDLGNSFMPGNVIMNEKIHVKKTHNNFVTTKVPMPYKDVLSLSLPQDQVLTQTKDQSGFGFWMMKGLEIRMTAVWHEGRGRVFGIRQLRGSLSFITF